MSIVVLQGIIVALAIVIMFLLGSLILTSKHLKDLKGRHLNLREKLDAISKQLDDELEHIAAWKERNRDE
jgi:predicted RND superfamily exporter protein